MKRIDSSIQRLIRRARPARWLALNPRIGLAVVMCGWAVCLAQPCVAAPGAPPREFTVKGVVKRLEAGSAVVQHETIPDYMEAMTMPFRAKFPAELAGLRPGDTISFHLLVTEEESWIERVARLEEAVPAPANSKPAPAPKKTPDTAAPRHPLLDFAFTNELRQPIRLRQFRGQALALTFIFTRCPIPDYCPRLSRNFETAARKLRAMPGGPTNYHFLSVSFDTQHDSPEVLKAYGERFGYDPSHWSFLTGPAEQIAELARLSGMKFERAGEFFGHNLCTLIIDSAGRLRMQFPLGGDLSDAIVEELVKAAASP